MKILKPCYVIEPFDGDAIIAKIERIGRTCYKSEDKIGPGTSRKFVKMLIERGHESVLEHASVSVSFTCDRGVSHELVRHRLASYSQESTRYCNYSQDKFNNEIMFVPMLTNLTKSQIERREALYRHMEDVYMTEIYEGVLPQQARDNLATCLKTEITMTCNLREWRHVFRLRTSKHAHPQMRGIMQPLLRDFRGLIPVVFDDVGETQD